MLLINREDIQRGIDLVEPHLKELREIYDLLPETRCGCDKPGQCCAFLPQMTWMEALQWFRYLKALPQADCDAMVKKFLAFFLTNPARAGHCPFLTRDGGCGNYEFRPFACRAYGMWSRKRGKEETARSSEGKAALLAAWRRYGIELPEETVVHEMAYCDQVSVSANKPPLDSRLMKLLSRIHRLDDADLEMKRRFEDGFQSDFSMLMASLVWGGTKANLNKYAVIKDLVQKGTDTRLQKLLAKATVPF